jgi:cellulose synthase/poly-beta-1,6-N-acetylglucosamine synthase-like glycosyltransferase
MLYFIFWLSLLILFYTFIGYAVLIFLLSKIIAKKASKQNIFPKVSVVIAAYNEEKVIAQRLKNLLGLDYPKEKLEILIVSDGSTDRTAEICCKFNVENIRLIEQKERSGKALCLNEAVPLSNGDIVVFSDARQRFEANALKHLVTYFNDPKIGAVSGELHFEEEAKTITGEGVDFYWKYEKFLRKAESKVDSVAGATGAIYAIRKNLFKPIPEDILLDDVLIPMHIIMQGYRCVFEPQAIAYDRIVKHGREEARRKTRTIAGNFQLFFRFPQLLNPLKNRIWFQIFSHKFLRLLAPIFIVSLLMSNILMADYPLFKLFLLLQGFFYLLVIMGYILRRTNLNCRIFSIPYAFILLNLITIKAFFQYLCLKPQNIWRTDKDKKV